MRPFIYLALVAISPLLAGIYGFLHDQVSYSVCSEYFTKIRFEDYAHFPELWHDRTKAGVIGILNAWKQGLLAGILLTAVATIHKQLNRILSYTLTSYGITIVVTALSALLGLYIHSGQSSTMAIYPDIENLQGLYQVTQMNNFAHMGGVIGMLFGMAYHMYRYKKDKKALAVEGN